MPDPTPESTEAGPPVVDRWQARPIKPVFVVVYTAVVLAALIPLAVFVFTTIAGTMTLAMTAIGAIVPLLFDLLIRVEYRLTDSGIDKRRMVRQKPAPFKELFRFPEVDSIVLTRYGFKYTKRMDPAPPVRSFLNRHVSDEYSGVVYVEQADRERILAHLAERGVLPPG